MKLFTQDLLKTLRAQLTEEDSVYDPLKLEDGRLALISDTMEKINEKLKSYVFASEKEEIDYFRNVWPEVLSLHVYYSWKIKWDRARSQGINKNLNKLKRKFISELKKFHREYGRFCDYIRDGRNLLDAYYFLRSSHANNERKYRFVIIKDPGSPPVHSGELGNYIAYNKLESELSSDFSMNEKPVSHKPICQWTGKQIDLLELIYAIYVMGSLDNGTATLKAIIESFEKIFGVRFSQPYRQFQDIITRKKDNMSYLQRAYEKLQEYIADILNRS